MDRAGANAAPGTPENPTPPSTEGKGAVEQVCRNCNEKKLVTAGSWAFRAGAPLQICLACQMARKADSHELRAADPNAPPKKKLPGTQKEIREAAKLDVARALKVGAGLINDHVEMAMARLLQYASDPNHRHHIWALDKLTDRIMPRKLYEELGASAAGVGGLHDKRPQFVIQVLPAQPSEPAGRVVEGEATTVSVLPAPSQ